MPLVSSQLLREGPEKSAESSDRTSCSSPVPMNRRVHQRTWIPSTGLQKPPSRLPRFSAGSQQKLKKQRPKQQVHHGRSDEKHRNFFNKSVSQKHHKHQWLSNHSELHQITVARKIPAHPVIP